MKLWNAAGEFDIEKLGYSTVVREGETAENRDKPNSWVNWAASFREAVSIIGKESEMKNLISKHTFTSAIATLLMGLIWVAVLEYSGNLSAEDFKVFALPLFLVLILGGIIVGAVGKQRGESLRKVLFSGVFGVGLSPFMVIPLMRFMAIPVGGLVANFGAFDPSTKPAVTASNIAMSIMITIWFIVSTTLAIVLLMLSAKPLPIYNHGQVKGSS